MALLEVELTEQEAGVAGVVCGSVGAGELGVGG